MTREAINRHIVFAAGISGALAVLLGSFGAHGLDTFLTDRGLAPELVLKRVDQFDVAVRYHLIHTVALLALASLTIGREVHRLWIARGFVIGLILFSGSLYALVLTNTPVLGAITPFGGLSWIASWLIVAWMARPGMIE